jgi:uncharacterized membrane protein
MNKAIYFLETHWLASALLVLALIVGGLVLMVRRRAGSWSLRLAGLGVGVALLGLGGMLVSPEYGMWLAIGALAVLFVMVFAMVLSGWWWAPLACVVGGVALLGLGGLGEEPAATVLSAAFAFVRNLRPLKPWWLLLLLLIPAIIALSFRSLAGLGPIRRWVAIGLRCALVLFLTLALAEAATTTRPDTTTVIFVLDLSQSIPEDLLVRAEKFMNDAVEKRGDDHARDQFAVVVFGKRPRLERPASNAGSLKFEYKEAADSVDDNYTNIAAAIKQALVSFPPGSGKRIVLISDGNQNQGNAEEQANFAKVDGTQIDVVPLVTGLRNENEVLVQSIEAPGVTELGSQLPIRVYVRSFNPNIVVGTLRVRYMKDGRQIDVVGSPLDGVPPRKKAVLEPGLNKFEFQQQLEGDKIDSQQSYTFEAEFQPEFVQDARGNFLFKDLPGDRKQNNRARTHVVARGQRRVLLIQKKPEPDKLSEYKFLGDRLAEAGEKKFKVTSMTTDQLAAFQDADRLALMLSDYDCVILANVPCEDVTERQQEVIRSNTHDQGCGLIMIGGHDSFGAGGWQKSNVEKALPVDCDIKSLKVKGKGGLVLIMHASEMANGNEWQKKVAKLAIEKLSPDDMVGITYYGWGGGGGHTWHIPFQVVGEDRSRLAKLVDQMSPGDMPDVDPALKMAYAALTKPEHQLVTKHIIFISDGDHWNASPAILAQLRAKKITCTTVCITSHGANEVAKMIAMAKATGGRAYPPTVKSPPLKGSQLPAIYVKESRLVSQSFVQESKEGIQPIFRRAAGPTSGLPKLDPLYGFVRTTPKPEVLVEMPIMTPEFKGQDFPLLAYWHYGLGKAAAFTSDALGAQDAWDRNWAKSKMYTQFWEQLVDWTLRPVESKRLTMTSEQRDGKVIVTVEARREDGEPDVRLTFKGGVTVAGGRVGDARVLTFQQKRSGVYVAEFKAEEAGSYFIDAASVRREKVRGKDGKMVEREVPIDSIRAGVTIPYSPEFLDMDADTELMKRLAAITDGKVYADDDVTLADVAKTGELFRPAAAIAKSLQPVWFWLVFASAVLLLCDVAVRRISIDPVQVAAGAQTVWDRLRGTASAEARAPEFFDRLRSTKVQVGQKLERGRAGRRFDAGDASVSAPEGADATSQPQPPRPATPSAPPPRSAAAEEEAGDYGSRLLRAKRRAMQDRDKQKDS